MGNDEYKLQCHRRSRNVLTPSKRKKPKKSRAVSTKFRKGTINIICAHAERTITEPRTREPTYFTTGTISTDNHSNPKFQNQRPNWVTIGPPASAMHAAHNCPTRPWPRPNAQTRKLPTGNTFSKPRWSSEGRLSSAQRRRVQSRAVPNRGSLLFGRIRIEYE